MSNSDNNTNPQFANGEAGALQLGAREQFQLEPIIALDKILSTAKSVIIMEEFPGDKIVTLSLECMVSVKAINITISKK